MVSTLLTNTFSSNGMAFLLLSLSLQSITSGVFAQEESCSAPSAGFTLILQNECNYSTLKAAYEKYLADPLIASSHCSGSLDDDLLKMLGATADTADEAVKSLCINSEEPTVHIPSMSSFEASDDWIKTFYDGGTDWNEETETSNTEGTNLFEPHGSTTNKLKKDAENVNVAQELSERYRMEYPDHVSNFDLEQCQLNSVMCCWPRDRQANDNNGNCKTPYDTNCVDKDPADNTDLCLTHHERHHDNDYADSISVFRGDNNDGEGAIHCHGFAWSNDETDVESRFRGNNLFYVSMFDHMYTRGYVENIPGAPMCACVEQMPVVTRSDCTQTDVTEKFRFIWNVDSQSFSVQVEDIRVNFNACQGLNNRNNDLEAYVARLETEGKVTKQQKIKLREHIVGNGNCGRAIERNLASKGIVPGFPDGAYSGVYEFPEVDTSQFVHGFCVTGASYAHAFSSDSNLSYRVVKNFSGGQKAWGDRSYTIENVDSGPCAGGIFLQPSRHKTIDRYTDISVGAEPIEGEPGAKVCAMLLTHDARHGRWPEKIFYDGFEKNVPDLSNLANEFHLVGDKGTLYGITTYCKDLPQQPTPAPTPVVPRNPPAESRLLGATLDTVGDTYIRGGSYKDINFGSDIAMLVKNDRNDSYDRKSIIQFDVSQTGFTNTSSAVLRLFVETKGTSDALITVSRIADDFAWDEGAITWRTYSPEIIKRGNDFPVSKGTDEGSWIDVSVSDLIQAAPLGNKLTLELSNRGSANSEGHVLFGTREGRKGAQLVKFHPNPEIAKEPTQEAYVRDGSYKNVRLGLTDEIVVKNDRSTTYDRKGIIEFDLSNIEVPSTSSAILRLYMKEVGDDATRYITVSRLNDNDWNEGTVSWSNLNPSVAMYGERFPVLNGQEGSWVDVSVSRLIQAVNNDKVTFFLENRGSAKSGGYVSFWAEGDGAPRLYIDDVEFLPTESPTATPTLSPTKTPAPSTDAQYTVDASADAYIRGGVYSVGNYGYDDSLVVDQESSSDKDRKTIIEFDLTQYDIKLQDSFNLKLFVTGVDNAGAQITVSRIDDSVEWKEGTVNMNYFNQHIKRLGNNFVLKPSDVGSWVEISVTSLIETSSDNNKVTLMLDNQGSARGDQGVIFSSRENPNGNGPQLVRAHPAPQVDIEAEQEAYVRSGKFGDSRKGLESTFLIKNDRNSDYDRKGVIDFDLGLYNFASATELTATLYLHVDSIGKDNLLISTARLNETDWYEGTVTWNNIDAEVIKYGNRVRVFEEDVDTWVEVSVTNLLLADTAADKLTLYLENRNTVGSEDWISFSAEEGGYTPRLVIDGNNIETIPTNAPSSSPTASPTETPSPTVLESVTSKAVADTFIQGGIYETGNYGLDDGMIVDNESSSSKDRKSIIAFDLNGLDFDEDDSAILRLWVNSVDDGGALITASLVSDEFEWDESTLSWISFDTSQVTKIGNAVPLNPTDAGSWVELSITDLVLDAVESDSDTLTLLLENRESPAGNIGVIFGTREGDKAAELTTVPLNAVDAKISTDDDSYIRNGSHAGTNFGVESQIIVKQDRSDSYDRKGLVEFDLRPFDISSTTSGLLRLYVKDIGSDSSRVLTVSRLNQSASDTDEASITWSTFDGQVVKYGNRFSVLQEHKESWVEVSVTNLLHTSVTDENTLVVFIENRGRSSSQGHVIFGSHEGGFAAELILDDVGIVSA